MSPVYAVRRKVQYLSTPITSVELLEDGKHQLDYNGLKMPITVMGHKVTFHVDQAEGNLKAGRLLGLGTGYGLSLAEIDLWSEMIVNLRPFRRSDETSPLEIEGDDEEDEPKLYIERHDRETKNFRSSPSKERE